VRLLISVMDPVEAADAASAGADIIDVKDPAAGSLGAAPPAWVRAIRAVTPAHLPVTAALGDGPFETRDVIGAALELAGAGACYVKLGLRDTSRDAAVDLLRAVRHALPPGTGMIAVGFADAARASCPATADLPELSAAAGADGCLVDTAVKDGRGLLDWMDHAALVELVAGCRARRLMCGLAGSLRMPELPRIAALQPDIVGVRGAACAGDRVAGRVSRERVLALARSLRAAAGDGVGAAREITSVP
jgi:uncharacterized protein (UPF0264 family)